MKRRYVSSLASVAFAGLALFLSAAPAAPQQSPDPQGGGYANPESDEPPASAREAEPVYRGPSIDTLATLRKRGVLRVGVAVAEPMVMHDEKGALVGFSIDLGRKLAEDLGVEVQFVETSWSRVIPDLLSNRFDLIASGMWMTPARALVVNFSDPTASEGIYLIAGRGLAGKMRSIEAFNRPESRIVVLAGSIQERIAAKRFPKATLVRVEGDDDALAPVLEGKAHAVLVPTFSPGGIVKGAPDKLFLPLDKPLQTTVTALAVRKGDADFLSFLNSWLTVRRDDGWTAERTAYWSEPANWIQ